MNKTYFFNTFQKEDSFLIAPIWEDIQLCLNIDYPIYGNIFLPPSIWSKIESMSDSLKLNIKTIGTSDFSEKKMIIFFPINFETENLISNVVHFKIVGTNKFKILQHKDFLGTIMSLGLKREFLGDIIVKDNIAYGVTTKDIFNIIESIEQVNKISVKVELCNKESIPNPEIKESPYTTSSLRLDSIISSILNTSRNISVNLIEAGDVSINYSIERNKSQIISENSTITIKKYGKFFFSKNLGENKKGKLKIIIQQFI